MVIKDNDRYKYDNDIPNSIGRVKPFYGNFGIYLKHILISDQWEPMV